MDKFPVKVKNKESGAEQEVEIIAYIPKVGRNKGKMRLQPEKFESWDLNHMINLWGEKLITKIVHSALKPKFGVFTDEATHELRKDAEGNTIYKDKEKKKPEYDVVTDENAIKVTYSDLFAVLSKRGETIQYLKRRYNENTQEQLELVALLIPEDGEPPSMEDSIKIQQQIRELREELKEIEKAIQEKKAADAEDDDDEKETSAVKVAA